MKMILVTENMLEKAFLTWSNEYRKNPSDFEVVDWARASPEDLAKRSTTYMFNLLEHMDLDVR